MNRAGGGLFPILCPTGERPIGAAASKFFSNFWLASGFTGWRAVQMSADSSASGAFFSTGELTFFRCRLLALVYVAEQHYLPNHIRWPAARS